MSGLKHLSVFRAVAGLLLFAAGGAWADSTGVIEAFPESGAFSAVHREDRGGISVIELTGNYDRSVTARSNIEPRAVVAREFFRTHADNYDFLMVFTTFDFDTGEAAAFHYRVQNRVQGIGLPQYDNSHLFGSDGRLLGYTDMAALGDWSMDATAPEFESLLSVMGHELLHQWSGNVRFDQGNGPESGLLGRGGVHWSNLLDTDASVLYGHQWRDNGDGTFTSSANRKFFSPLDLYLAGLYGPDEVPPMTLIENASVSAAFTPEESLTEHGPTIEGTARTVTIDDIIAAEGARVPSAAGAQKRFRIGFVLLTGQDEPVSARMVGAVDTARRAFVDRFSIWTGGRATVDAYPEDIPEHASGSPDVLAGTPRVDTASLQEGFLWLRSQQSDEGFWRDKPATTVRDTSVVLNVLSRFDPNFAGGEEARNWLTDRQSENTDFLARKLLVYRRNGLVLPEALRTRLTDLQNADGGWGFNKGFESDPLDTALVLQGVTGLAGVSEAVTDAGVNYLLSLQNEDGGWANRSDSPSRTGVTTMVLGTLNAAGRAGPAIPPALAFLAERQNPDGGFGDSPSTPHDTANVLALLTDLEALDSARASDAADYLLARQSEDGSWNGSRYTTARVLAALQRFSFTNWALGPLNVEPVSAVDGDRLRLSVRVSNDTAEDAPGTVLRFFDGPVATGEQIGSDITVPALRAGGTTQLSLLWDTSGRAGQHTLTAVIDPENAHEETSEQDNRSSTVYTVAEAPAGIDLSIDARDVAVMPAAPDYLPAELGFAAMVRNVGLSDAPGVTVQLRAGAVGGPVVAERMLDITSRGSAAVNFTDTVTEPGDHLYFIVVDPDNAVVEAREDNNSVEMMVSTTDGLDMAVSDADIDANIASPVVGDDVEFTVTLHNLGTVESPSTPVQYLITDGDTTVPLQVNQVQIEAGRSVQRTVVWRVEREGDFTFTVQLDPDNLLAERREDNNAGSLPFSAGRTSGPNLAVDYKDFSFDPDPGREARELTLNALVRNTGTEDADAFEVAFYNGNPDDDGVLIESAQTVPGLAADESIEVSLSWPAVPDAQDKLLFVVVDPADVVAEASEVDNSAFNTLEIDSLADLAVSTGDITLSPAFPAGGDEVSIAVRVANLGQQDAIGAVVRIFDGDPEAGGTQVGGDQTIDIAGNEAGIVNVGFTLAPTRGPMEALYVQVDPEDVILEQTELNNNALREFLVQDGDFAVSRRYISPDGDGVQDTTDFFYRLEQATEAGVVIVNERAEVVRRFNDSPLATLTEGQVHWDGLDDAGRVVRDGLYRLQVHTTDGTVLGEAAVTVDTNRLPLMKAEGTDYASYTNLTCQVERYDNLIASAEDDAYLFEISGGDDTFANGVYRTGQSGGSPEPVVLEGDIQPDADIQHFVADDDLSTVAIKVDLPEDSVWLADGDGGNLRHRWTATNGAVNLVGFAGAEDEIIVYRGGSDFYALAIEGDDEPRGLTGFTELEELVDWSLGPRGRYLLLDLADTSARTRRLVAVDIESGVPDELVIHTGLTGIYPSDENFWRFSWSPEGTRIALVHSRSGDLVIMSERGDVLNTVTWRDPTGGGLLEHLSAPRWSTISDELTFSAEYYSPCCGYGYGDEDGEDIDRGGLYLVADVLSSESADRIYVYPARDDGSSGYSGLSVLDELVPGAVAQVLDAPYVPGPYYSDYLWLPNERTWLFRSETVYGDTVTDVFAFFLDELGLPEPVFDEFTDGDDLGAFRTVATGRQLLFELGIEGEDAGSSCSGDTDVWSFRSLLNLTVDLRAIRSADSGGIRLSGTAADAHLSQYRLEYAYADAPDTWRPVQPASGRAVIDDQFTVWVPPAPGTYFVRLTVTDRAGNQRRQVQRVSWSEVSAVTDLYRSPALFSPNGDGTADYSRVQYRVLAPVHLEFRFYDAQQRLVRTIVRDHTEIGRTFSFDWDGRDDNGVVLPDGEYRMTVQNYEFFFQIDATAPDVQFVLRDAYQPKELYDSAGKFVGTVASAKPSLTYLVRDRFHADSAIEWADVNTPNLWQFYAPASPGKPSVGETHLKDLALSTDRGTRDDVAGRRYRLVAEDAAGNSTVVEAGPAEEQLIVTNFGEHRLNQGLMSALRAKGLHVPAGTDEVDNYGIENPGVGDMTWIFAYNGPWYEPASSVPYAEMDSESGGRPPLSVDMSRIRFDIKETIRPWVDTMEVQYRLLDSTEWEASRPDRYFSEAHFTSVAPVSHPSVADVETAYSALWTPPAGIARGETYVVRLRAFSPDGVEHVSNAFQVKFKEHITFGGLESQAGPPEQAYVASLLDQRPASDEYVLWGRVFSGRTPDIEVFVSSDQDPRYAVERKVGSYSAADTGYAVITSDLTNCWNYNVRVVAHVEARVDPDTGEQLPAQQLEATGDFNVPCLQLFTDVEPVLATDCGAPSPEQLRIRFAPISNDDSPLQLLALATDDAEDVIYNVNQPAEARLLFGVPVEYNYEYILDTSNMVAGVHRFRAKLANANGDEVTHPVRFVVDRTPPTAAIDYPADGDRVCGVQRTVTIDGASEQFSVLTFEGRMQDNVSFGYLMDFGPAGIDEPPDYRFHDSNPEPEWLENTAWAPQWKPPYFDSFQIAGGRAILRKGARYPPASINASAETSAIDPLLDGVSGPNTPVRQAGSLGELYNLHGQYDVRLQVYDWGGHRQCVDRVVEFDGGVDVGEVTVDSGLFSPSLDEAVVRYTLDENAELDVNVYRAVVGSDNQPELTDESVRQLQAGQQKLAGTGEFVWDGFNNASSPVEDGLYGIELVFTDGCGNQHSNVRFVEIDNTPPAIDVIYPTSDSELPLMVEVQGTITDSNFGSYSVDIGAGHAPETWEPLGGDDRPVSTARVLARWNTFGLQGPYTIRVRAGDRAGNRSEKIIPLTLTQPVMLISLLEAVEPLFSPNGDGRRESTAIRFNLEEPVIASLRVVQSGGTVRQLMDSVALAAGPQTVPWHGRNDAGERVAGGDYKITLEAVLASDDLISQSEQVSVTVDTTAPTVEVDYPSGGFVAGGKAVMGTVSDLHMGGYSVLLTDNPEAPVWAQIAEGNVNRSGSVLARLDSELEGDYALRVEAIDLAENRTERIVPFAIDNTPPQVSLVVPEDNAYVSGEAGPAVVTGEIVEANPANYTLGYRPADANTVTLIADGDQFPLGAELATWDISGIADGAYRLVFEVEDLAGHSGADEHIVHVDNTPPTAEITAPGADEWLRAGDLIQGTAADTNLEEYRLEVAPEPGGGYSPLSTGTTSVDAGALHEVDLLPADGRYTLRLSVIDRAGNETQVTVPVRVDTTPPAVSTGLTATVENDRDARLTWNANTETDLDGYLVYRDGVQVTSEPIPDTEYLDTGLAQGTYEYTVAAVDLAGNESGRSESAEALIDVLPPTVRVSAPADGTEVGGLVEVRGTAHSSDDFKEYRLYVARADTPDARQLLRRSPVPVQADILGEWNTVSLPESQAYVISLEGEDINGNVADDSVTVSIDNQPPAQPTGLVATADGADVNLTWDANSEDDLLGYLVFRDGRIANATGTVVGDLEPYAVVETVYDDLELPDGPYEYTIVAIDDAGNLSEASAPDDVMIDTRPPKAVIVTPTDGKEFEDPQYVLAASEDRDIEQVRIQYRAAGDATWIELNTDAELPYDGDLNPDALGLVQGDYELRALATDLSGQADPDPASITVIYRDLTAPDAVVDLTATVNGGDVTLNWTANTEGDLAGYMVGRLDEDDNIVPLAEEAIEATTYVDSELDDAQYRYVVSAVDETGNISETSEPVQAVVHTPVLEPVVSPTPNAEETVDGQGVTPATLNATVADSSGSVELPPVETATDGAFSFTAPLAVDTNTVTVRLTDPDGNVSKAASMEIVRGDIPAPPTGLSGAATDTQLNLNWDTNPEPNIAGYRIFRNDEPVLGDTEVPDIDAEASDEHSWAPASNVVDDSTSTYWAPPSPYDEQWIAVEWAEPRLIRTVSLRWRNSSYALPAYDIQGYFRGDWVTLAQVRNAADEIEHAVELPRPYMTTSIRLVIVGTEYTNLSDISVVEIPLVDSTTFSEDEPDGIQAYTVTAVNEFGFESEPSDPAEVAVGDVTPPDAVTLTADIEGSDINLSWTASASGDTTEYRLFRDGDPIGQVTDLSDLTYRDAGLVNGTYRYTAVAVDNRGNESAPSNEATAVVNVIGQIDLSVTADPRGSALALAWTEPAGLTPTVYNIHRATQSGGPYERIDSVDAAQVTYDDEPLTDQTTYYYVVIAVDQSSRQSVTSVEAGATPLDVSEPAVPMLLTPTRTGRPVTLYESPVAIGGLTEPGVTVELSHDGANIGEVESRSDSEAGIPVSINSYPRVSPDGRYVISRSYRQLLLGDFMTGAETVIDLNFSSSIYPRWSPDSKRFLYLGDDGNDYLRAYRLEDGTSVALTDPAVSHVTFGAYSPDGSRLAVLGSYDDGTENRSGLWTIDLESGEWSLLLERSYSYFDRDSLHWSPDGEKIAYINLDGYPDVPEVVNVASGAVTVVDSERDAQNVSWHPGSESLAYDAYDSSVGEYVTFMYTLDSGETTLAAGGDEHEARVPHFSPDGRLLAYYDQSIDRIYQLNLETGEESLMFESNYLNFLDWTATGHLFARIDGGGALIAPPGWFEFPGVSLNLGDNIFTATATDSAGNRSDASDSILVHYTLNNRADLAVAADGIRVLPATPTTGELARVGITVANVGNGTSIPTTVSAMAISPSGESTELLGSAAVDALAPGASQTLNADWLIEGEAGDYTLVVVVDPSDQVAEISEANNTAIKTQPVSGEGGLALSVSTNLSTYPAGSPVNVSMGIGNGGSAFDGRYELVIQDEAGYPVTALLSEAVDSLMFNESVSRTVEWAADSVLAGNYRAVLTVYNEAGEPLQSRQAGFAITGAVTVDASVSTDSLQYPANSDVRVTGTVEYADGNAPFDGGTALLRIFNADSALLAQSNRELPALLIGDGTAVTLDWNTGLRAPGEYRVEFEVRREGQIAAQAQNAFDIENSGPLVNGDIALSDEAPDFGEPVTATFDVTNIGNAAINQLPVTVAVVDSQTQTTVQSASFTPDIGTGKSFSGSAQIDAVPALRAYNVLLQAQTGDGNQVLATARFAPQDRVPPAVSVQTPAGDSVIRGGADTVIAASDAHSGVDRVEYRVDGGSWQQASIHNVLAGEYGDTLSGLGEGDHLLEARATDGAGNTGLSAAISFTVDNTPPVITVEGVTDGALTNTPVTPVVTVNDDNPAGRTILLNGEPFDSGTQIGSEDEYDLFVTASDRAGNTSEARLTFGIDMTPPQIVVSGVEDGEIVAAPVTPVIEVTDDNFAVQNVLLNGEPFDSGTQIDQDGVYSLDVTAEDLAGNQAVENVEFEIDTTAPSLAVTTPADGAVVTTPGVDIVGQTEAGATVQLARAGYDTRSVLADDNGAFTFSEVALELGGNPLVFTAKDSVGNTSEPVDWMVVREQASSAELDGRIVAGTRVLIWADEPHYSPSVGQISAVLDDAGVEYTVVERESAFVSHMRSRRYTVLMLLDLFNAGYGSNRFLHISRSTLDEISATVASGTGLVMFKSHPSNANVRDELFGAKVKGHLPWVDGLTIEDSPAGSQAELDVYGHGVKFKLKGGTSVGWWDGYKHHHQHRKPAFVINNHGDGRTALLGFDPAMLSDQQVRREVITDLLDFATPQQADLIPGGTVELQWTADALNAPIELLLHGDLSEGMEYLTVFDGDILTPVLAEWRLNTDADSARFSAVIQLPDSTGSFDIMATLYRDEAGVLNEIASGEFTVSIENTVSMVENGALDRVNDIGNQCRLDERGGRRDDDHRHGDHRGDNHRGDNRRGDDRRHDNRRDDEPWDKRYRDKGQPKENRRYDHQSYKNDGFGGGHHDDRDHSRRDRCESDRSYGKHGGRKGGGWWFFDFFWGGHGGDGDRCDDSGDNGGHGIPPGCPTGHQHRSLDWAIEQLRAGLGRDKRDKWSLERSIDDVTDAYLTLRAIDFPARHELLNTLKWLLRAYQQDWFDLSPYCEDQRFRFDKHHGFDKHRDVCGRHSGSFDRWAQATPRPPQRLFF